MNTRGELAAKLVQLTEKAQLAEVLAHRAVQLIADLYDPNDCVPDSNGTSCFIHDWDSSQHEGRVCPHWRARNLLNQRKP